MLFTLQLFYENTQNDVHSNDIKVNKCISLESIMFLYYKKQVVSQIPDVYFSLLIFIVYFKQIFFSHTHIYNKLVFQGSLTYLHTYLDP